MELFRGGENRFVDILVHASLLSSQQLDLIALKVTRLDRLRVNATIGSTFPGAKKPLGVLCGPPLSEQRPKCPTASPICPPGWAR